ncbi:tetratricopeptide repeat protein [Rhodopirellula sp. MGV]|uniref:tetratricopeptide repeat protein n=1 Tax=Rhodopirellula sp. MGV TaxID=2023130 RepID=UPI000BD6D5C7|nr:tetratricopeptide repeat protein [Rhodopirellula sp. MGV]OYP35828.1 hypothetical protein CGZ80_10550 [Rhodopirellula sp. MGV]PNY36359.1 hypothetical protein C2E31_13060 [Rhodopirellula baltica]
MTSSEIQVDVEERFQKAMDLHREGELTDAESLYQAVLKDDPDHADSLQLLGVIAAQLGDLPLAVKRTELALSKYPDQPVTYNNLGNMLVELDRFEEAISAYENAIQLRPDYSQASLNLGHVLCQADNLLYAEHAYRKVTELEPQNADGWDSLGDTLHKLGRSEEALVAFSTAVEAAPERVKIRHRQGMVLRSLDRLDEAAEIYRECLVLSPEDPIAKHFLAVCGDQTEMPERVSKEYVREAFDEFAATFDEVLKDLEYSVPERLGALAQEFVQGSGKQTADIVDLGCGTGLCQPHLAEVASQLVGVDLSKEMLAKAQLRGGYDELVQAELTDYLSTCGQPFDVAIAADVFIYIGDLRSTFEAASMALRPNGGLIFSMEKMDESDRDQSPNGYRLGTSGRYQHDKTVFSQWLSESGFEIEQILEEHVRNEGKVPVTGYLVVATKRATK